MIASLCLLLLTQTSTGAVPSSPNVILIMADDLGWGDVGFNGNRVIQTPHLDEMARSGLVMKRFYAAAPVCSPTRGSCLTGRHPSRYGIPGANSGHLQEREHTLAELLSSRGFRCGHFGKWHLGTLSDDYSGKGPGRKPELNFMSPQGAGFENWFSTEFAVATWDPYLPEHSHVKGKRAGDRRNLYWENGSPIQEDLHGCDSRIIMDRALPFIEQSIQQESPFLAVIWFHAPHEPIVAGPDYLARYEEQPEPARHYYGCITAMDEQIGRLRQHLKQWQVAENTLIAFCSDNGPEGKNQGQGRRFGSAANLRGRKRSLYEGGIRVPAILEWPAKIQAGTTSSFPASTSDYYPTIAAILSEAPSSDQARDTEPLDGRSLVSVFTQPDGQRNSGIGFQSRNQKAWIEDQYKIISQNRGETWELYDLRVDESESRDLSAEKPDELARMLPLYTAWEKSCEVSMSAR